MHNNILKLYYVFHMLNLIYLNIYFLFLLFSLLNENELNTIQYLLKLTCYIFFFKIRQFNTNMTRSQRHINFQCISCFMFVSVREVNADDLHNHTVCLQASCLEISPC